MDVNEKKKKLEEVKTEDRKEKFDLKDVPFRVMLCKIEKDKYEMMISNHHILYDGWSNGIILKEFFQAYDKLCQGDNLISPAKPRGKFKEFIQWIQNQDIKRQEKFWQEYLKGFDGPKEISVKQRKTRKGIRPQVYYRAIPRDIKKKFENFVKRVKITLSALLYSSWGLLLQKYNNTDNILFGTVVSGRSAKIESIEETVGLFINTIPLRVRTYGDERVLELLSCTNETLQVRAEYESTPLVRIREYSEGTSNEELFDSIVVIENYPLDAHLKGRESQLTVNSYSMNEMSNYDLTVIISIFDGIEIELIYDGVIFASESISRLCSHFINILQDIENNAEKRVSEINILSEEEKRQLLVDFNDTKADYSYDKTIWGLFAEQVGRIPDHIALVGKEEGGKGEVPCRQVSDTCAEASLRAKSQELRAVTYKELNEKSHQLAYLLRQKGVGHDTIVGIVVERSIEMIISIYGILKAGAAYLPIDPGYPQERMNYILADSRAKFLVTTTGLSEKFEKLLIVNCQLLMVNEKPSVHPGLNISPKEANLAYVIYTSGSTGNPKGVLVEQRSAVNILTALQKEYPLKESDTYLLKTAYVFDVSITEQFGWFLGGGRLAILEKNSEKDPGKIIDAIEYFSITHINFVPSMFNVFVDELNPKNISKLSTLKYIFLAGEALLPELVNRLRRLNLHRYTGSSIRLENIYGPSEGTVYSSKYSLCQWNGSGSIPIGRPMQNNRLYILDRDKRLQPVGVPGELCIGGVGVARGYLNRPELTAEKFRFFSYKSSRSYRSYISKKLYKTGDLCRWLWDGNIEFLGRMDFQVKIRGFRIELGEIESRLLNHPLVKEAVVTVWENKRGEKILCAYIVSGTPVVGDVAFYTELREYLSGTLPDYMIPSYFVRLDRLPLTSTGKVNRNALPEPEIKTNKKYIAPRNKGEELLVDIWSQVLNLEKQNIGIDDHFFELGGHSLKVTGMIGRIHRAFDIKIPFSVVFETPTIRKIYHYIREAETKIYQAIPWAEEKEYYPLTPTQRRFYVFQQLKPGDISYNMPETMLIEGQLSRERLEVAFRQLLFRHESLRTSFHMVKGEPVQQFHQEVAFGVEYHDLEHVKARKPEKIAWDFVRPFDLTQPPLWRVGLVKTAPDKYLLMFDMHHLIADGTSIGIFIRDFLLIYNQGPLPPLKVRSRDYVEWQEWRREKTGKGSWEAPLHDEAEDQLLNLPTDFPRPAVPTFAGRRIRFDMEVKESKALYQLSISQDVTLYMVLLAVYNVLLSKLSGQENIAVGSPIAGRIHVDLDNVVGLFLNILCLRNQPSVGKTFSAFLQEVRQRAITTFENQDYQYDELVAQAALARETGRNPLFDVMLVLQNMEMPEVHIPGLKVTREIGEHRTSKFDMTLFCEEKESLVFRLEYSTDLFKPETGSRFIRYFQQVISQVLQNPHQKIADIEIIPGEEKQQILYDFNATESDYPHDQTLHRLFVQQAERTSDHTALVGQIPRGGHPQPITIYQSLIGN
ncbi:MAG: amino acid adenylation domain-containing protein [Candidatus Aminicenantes bacterium]|nr:MAG: amino acid adenylation domain-containing protein [Candidatus Aminicenantes bacterium]